MLLNFTERPSNVDFLLMLFSPKTVKKNLCEKKHFFVCIVHSIDGMSGVKNISQITADNDTSVYCSFYFTHTGKIGIRFVFG